MFSGKRIFKYFGKVEFIQLFHNIFLNYKSFTYSISDGRSTIFDFEMKPEES